MEMTLDDLVEEFRKHPTTREGVRHIVLALRDESGRRGYLNWDNFNAILGDAVEKEPSHD